MTNAVDRGVGLNAQQRDAVQHGDDPLLIIAGAGTGKTNTLVHRVVQLIQRGIAPDRILLLTFTRRASSEMLRRAQALLRELAISRSKAGVPGSDTALRVWGGTFHATAARQLRMLGHHIGLAPSFSIHDRSDSEDLLNVARTQLGLSQHAKRFPKKRTCLSIYSHCVNSQRPLEHILATISLVRTTSQS
jgi:DNA helicase-2/ATP-dependent DNA helicase PcrA